MMKSKVYLYILCFILIATNNSCNKKEKNMNTHNQPIYELYIDARGCYFEILINDVPVYFHYNIGATSFRLPINNYIPKSGEHSISLRMKSVVLGKSFPKETMVSLKIDKYPKGLPRDRKGIFSYKTPIFEEKNNGVFIDTMTFKVIVPYTLTNWQTGIDLTKENKENLRKEIESFYKEYTLAFKNKNLSKYIELTEIRQTNTFLSLYYNVEQKKKVESSYLDGIQNSKVKLFPLENYKLVFYGKGRLVGLQKQKEAPGIFIDNEDEKDTFMEYILFYRKDSKSPLKIIF
uniref:hypothetical protein n=1 Tax=Ornithobacterium rhinotracheale TaxID=28251 RepID=UPI0039A4CD9B